MVSEQWLWTEQEWLSCSDPDNLLRGIDLLVEQTRVSISERKWVLLMVACLRRIQHVFRDERSRMLVAAIEQYADGLLTQEDVNQTSLRAVDLPNPDNYSNLPKEPLSDDQLRVAYAWDALVAACPPLDKSDIVGDLRNVTFAAAQAAPQPHQERRVQTDLLRDIVGNPFRPISLPATGFPSEAAKFAQTAYEERSLPTGILSASRLATLSDALKDGGCTDSHMLSHCREPGPHVRGCWVVDLILGKK
jgi:hypothetical protein